MLTKRWTRLAGLGLLLMSFVGGWFWMSMSSFADAPLRLQSEQQDFIIPAGSSFSAVARKLAQQEIIGSARKLVVLARLRGVADQVQAGEYQLDAGMSVGQMLTSFVSGKVKQYSFTIVEGWNFKQLRQALAEYDKLVKILSEDSDAEIMRKLGRGDEHPEGRFLPDTYHFPAGTTDLQFLKRAMQSMDAVLAESWENRLGALPYETPYDALIMASIVEKETAVPEERPAIAGVFVRRLERGMRLQTDPTVIYGLGDEYKGNLRKRHLKQDTPYNTYRRKGLTPTPIAMPGREAIVAALHPEQSEALYFVAKGDGSHHFSATVEEHNRAVRKYQIRQRPKDYRSRPKEQ